MKAVSPRVSRRIGIWAVALFITYLGPFFSVHPVFSVFEWAKRINEDGEARDIILSTIGISVLAASNIMDGLIRNSSNISILSKCATPLLFAFFVILSISGVYVYAKIPKLLEPDDFVLAWSSIEITVGIALFTELLIAVEVE